MASAEGQKLIRELAAKSDIVIENFKVGGLKKYGLDYDSLKAVNPKLIYCSITGFGQDGPYAQRAGYDFMIQGMAGIMSITGQPDGPPMKSRRCLCRYLHRPLCGDRHDRRPLPPGPHGRRPACRHGAAGFSGRRAGQPGAQLSGGRQGAGRLGNAHPNIVPYQTFETKDGHIIIAVGTDRQFREYCTIIGAPACQMMSASTAIAPAWKTGHDLIPLLAGPMKARTTADWVAAFEAAAIPCGPINTIDQVFADPQVLARGLQIGLTRDDGVQVPGVANPIRFSADPGRIRKSPAKAGGWDGCCSGPSAWD